MKSRKFIIIWFSASLIILLYTYFFNYFIDPNGYNYKYNFSFNSIKSRRDERNQKFEYIKSEKYNTYIFGNSRNTYMDPSYLDKVFSSKGAEFKSINVAFSSATTKEILMYIEYMLHNNIDMKNIFIGIDLFAFDDDYKPNGTLPDELTDKHNSRLKEYITIDMLKASFKTIYHNIKNPLAQTEKKFVKKGMRYEVGYFRSRKEGSLEKYTYANVTTQKAKWLSAKFSDTQVNSLQEIYKRLTSQGVNVYLFTNTLTYQLIFQDENFKTQINLLRALLADDEIKIYDFNNLNSVNFDNIFFIDSWHASYDVGACMFDRMLKGESTCADDFGVLLTSGNYEEYLNIVEQEWTYLKKDQRYKKLAVEYH